MSFFIIVGMVICITIIIGAIVGHNTESKKAVAYITAIVTMVVVGTITLFTSCTSVPTGYTGILTTFGRVENTTLDAGLRMKAPWQSIVKMDNRIQKVSVTLSCFSSDIQELNILYTLNYQIDKVNAMNIYASIGTKYYITVIEPAISESVKIITARYTAEDIIGNRSELALQVERLLSETLNHYNINIVGTAIEDIDFTDAFTNAVEAKQVAAQNKLQAEIEQERKTMEQEASAARAVIDAQAAAEVAKIQAEADLEVIKIQADAAEYAGQKEAAKNQAIARSLTPDLINYYYIDRWNGELPESYVGSDNPSTIVSLR